MKRDYNLGYKGKVSQTTDVRSKIAFKINEETSFIDISSAKLFSNGLTFIQIKWIYYYTKVKLMQLKYEIESILDKRNNEINSVWIMFILLKTVIMH